MSPIQPQYSYRKKYYCNAKRESFIASNRNNVLLLLFSHNQVSGIGARELWGTLRKNSQVKLEKQDDIIPRDVKVRSTLRRSWD